MRFEMLPREPGPVHFHLSVDPAEIGAKAGDKVEVQVLYSADGHQPASMAGPMASRRPAAGGPGHPLLSNRIELHLTK